MRKAADPIEATEEQKNLLITWARAGKTEQRVAFRCHIVLRAITGESNSAIAKELGTSRPSVILWRSRFQQDGPQALLRDLPRGKPLPSLPRAKTEEIIEKTLHTKPKDATQWSRRSMAKHCGVSRSSVQRIWEAHGLKPHLVKTFKLSRD